MSIGSAFAPSTTVLLIPQKRSIKLVFCWLAMLKAAELMSLCLSHAVERTAFMSRMGSGL